MALQFQPSYIDNELQGRDGNDFGEDNLAALSSKYGAGGSQIPGAGNASSGRSSLPTSIDPSAIQWGGEVGAKQHREDHAETRQDNNDARTSNNEAARIAMERAKTLADLRGKGLTMDATGNITPLPSTVSSNLKGAAYLKTLSPADAAQVQAYAEGRLAFPPRLNEISQAKLDKVTQYDPEFDAINFNARAGVRRDFTSGKSAQNIKALNTALGHLGHLGDQIDGTASHGGFPFATTVNSIQNAIARSSGDSGPTKYDQTAGALSGELTQVFRGTGGAEADIQRYLGELANNGSHEQKIGAVGNIADLLHSRLDALNDQYQKGMGTTAQPLATLDPHADQVLRKYLPGYTGNGSGGGTPPSGPGGNGAPAPGSGPLIPMQKGGGDPAQDTLASGGDSQKSIAIPPQMQAEYDTYMTHNGRNLDPDHYAAFRADLDSRNGFSVTPAQMASYRDWAKSVAPVGKSGGVIDTRIPPANRDMTGQEKLNASLFNNPVGAAVLGAGSMGGAADEIVGTGKALLTGGDINSTIAAMNAMRQAAAREYPKSTLAGNFAGAIGTGYAAGGAPLLAGASESGLGTAALGAGYGGVTGAFENNDNRLGGAITGAMLGSAGGLAGKYGLAPLAETIGRSSTGQKIADLADTVLAKTRGQGLTRLPVPSMTPADKAILGVDANLGNVRTNMSDAADLGLPYALADADPKLRMLGGAVTRKSIDARDLAEQVFDPRARGQADRAIAAIDTHLAPITDIEQRGSDLLEAADQAASPSYTMAMNRAGPVDPQIDAMLQTPAGREAMSRARTMAANEGKDPTTMGFDLNDQGQVILKDVPSFETLQMVKRGLDSHVEDFRDPLTQQLNLRKNPMAQSVDDLRKRFVGRLGEINPDYAEGNAEWARYAQRKDALDLGHEILPKGTLPVRDFQSSIDRIGQYDDNLPPELTGHVTLPEVQRGYATSMADTVDRQRLARDPYDAVYGSPQQQSKIDALFPDGAPQFDRQYNLERDMSKTRNETLGGSPTAGRLQADDQLGGMFGDMAAEGIGQAISGGGIPGGGTLFKLARQYLGDSAKLGIGSAGQRKASEMAPVLFDTSDPRSVIQTLDDLLAKKSQQDARDALYQKYGSLFGSAALPGVAIGP
jgi:hypothetical protein